jgi:hypothetical protein
MIGPTLLRWVEWVGVQYKCPGTCAPAGLFRYRLPSVAGKFLGIDVNVFEGGRAAADSRAGTNATNEV